MTHSKETDRFHLNDRYRDERHRAVDMFVIHHTAGTNNAVAEETVAGYGRRSSANYFITNSGEVVCVVDEDFGAWSVGNHVWEQRAVSVEVVNSAGAPNWPISAAAAESLARLVADVAARRGFPLDREHVIGHKEVVQRFGVGYSTACPGGIPMDAIVNRARQINAGGGLNPAPVQPKPGKPTGQKAPAFPLPAGWYFGPKSGPKQSVSGYFSHREDLKRFMAQMAKRGWTFPKHGIDGLYGDELRDNVIAFQREKNLVPDGEIGIKTWNAAWEAPVT